MVAWDSTCEDELDAPEGCFGPSDVPRNCFQVLKQRGIHHGDLHASPSSVG